jgi:hypothetical protein
VTVFLLKDFKKIQFDGNWANPREKVSKNQYASIRPSASKPILNQK